MRHFTSIKDLTGDELIGILDRADILRALWHQNDMPNSLRHQKIALWFAGNGFRNRLAFEIGARSMGADVTYVPGELGVDEPLEDIPLYLKNWFTLLVVRAKKNADFDFLANSNALPVINARTDFNHPCEIMGDLQYIRRERGSLEDLNVVFVGEVTNLCMSWFEAAARLPITVTQIAPTGYTADRETLRLLNRDAKGRIFAGTDLEREIGARTDVVYTDCWPRGGDADKIRDLFLPFQITKEHIGKMNPDGFYLPCPPVTRGREVSADSLTAAQFKNYAAKENLLHAQNAIMEFIVHENGTL